MPRKIGTTISVDGEAAFKRAINDANTSLRNMGTQLTLAQAQFKKDGDAMKLMETRSKALKSEIGQQGEIVRALEKAVEDSTKAYGENSAKTEKWQAELNRAKSKLIGLQSELTLNEAGLDRNGKAFDENSQKAADYQATLQTIGKNVSFEAVTKGISGITGGFEAALKKVWGFAKGLKDAMVDSGQWADDLITDATKYGLGTEELQRWRYASQFVDTEVETIVNAAQKLNTKMVKGWTNDKMNVWEFLGIDVKNDKNQYRDQIDVMFELGETLLNMTKIDGNDARAEQYAMEAFGKSWKELMPLFTAGRDAWEKYMAEATVVSDENVHALGDSYDAVQRLESSWETLKLDFFAQIAPTMTEVTDALSGMLKEFNEWIETEEGKQAMADLSAAIKELFSGLTDIKFGDALNVAKDAVNAVKDALVWLSKNKNGVYTALEVIGGGFALLKVSDTVLRFLQLKNGLAGLTGGGGSVPKVTPVGTGGSPVVKGAAAGGASAGAASTVGGLAAKVASSGAAAAVGSGLSSMVPVLGDVFLNQTNAGRALRDGEGISGVMAGLQRDLSEKAEELIVNVATFADNWDPKGENANVFATSFGIAQELAKSILSRPKLGSDEYLMEATQEDPELIRAFKAFVTAQDAQSRLTGAEDWDEQLRIIEAATAAAEEFWKQEGSGALYDAYEAWRQRQSMGNNWWGLPADMSEVTGDTIQNAISDTLVNLGRGGKTSPIMGAVAAMLNSGMLGGNGNGTTIKDLPAEVEKGAREGITKGISGMYIKMDGYTVARIVTPYVSASIGMSANNA